MKTNLAQEKTLLDNYRLMFALVVVFQLIFAAANIEPSIFEKNYPDGPMRLLSVQDLLNGQAWFDTVQHRVLPPDGLNLHWSRFIDGAIAGLILLFGLFLAPQNALTAAVLAWPMLLLFGYIAIIGQVARSQFSNKVASFAIFAGAFSPYTYGTFFSPGALDHHNVQVVCVAAIFWALAGRGQDRKHGIIGGIATAVSLAVGLETALFIALVMLIFLVLFIRGSDGIGTRMGAFGVSLGIAAPVLFALQTNPAEWAVMYCDELAPPVLVVTTMAAILGLLLPWIAPPDRSVKYRFLASIGMIVLALAVIYPVMKPCIVSPYANVPAEVRYAVIANNTENYSVLAYFLNAPVQGISYVLPLILLIALLWPTVRQRGPARQTRALLLVFCAFSLLAGFAQVRLLVPGFALLPLAFGIVAADFVAARPGGIRYILHLIAVVTLIFTPLVAMAIVAPFRQEVPVQSRPFDYNCLAGNTVEPLTALPASVIFTPLNLGPKVLQYTDHSVTGASYHRSPDALVNGMLRFNGSVEDMAKAVEKTGSRYIIVCRGQIYGAAESVGSQLATGAPIDGLRELSQPGDVVRVFEVLPNFTK